MSPFTFNDEFIPVNRPELDPCCLIPFKGNSCSANCGTNSSSNNMSTSSLHTYIQIT